MGFFRSGRCQFSAHEADDDGGEDAGRKLWVDEVINIGETCSKEHV